MIAIDRGGKRGAVIGEPPFKEHTAKKHTEDRSPAAAPTPHVLAM
jgi:hypothetical protein